MESPRGNAGLFWWRRREPRGNAGHFLRPRSPEDSPNGAEGTLRERQGAEKVPWGAPWGAKREQKEPPGAKRVPPKKRAFRKSEKRPKKWKK